MIMLIPIDSIAVEERQRQHMEGVEELAESIESVGLIHPITVRQKDNRPFLVAGGRRLEALRMLYSQGKQITFAGKPVPLGEVPVTWIEFMTDVHAAEMELEENVARINLTWQDQVRALALIHEMKKRLDPSWNESGTASIVTGRDDPSPRVTSAIRQKLVLAQYLDDPEIAKCDSMSTAMKRLIDKTMLDLVKAIPKPERDNWQIEHADCIDWLRKQPDGTIDCIVTDPPYGISADEGCFYGHYGHGYDDSEEYFTRTMLEFMPHSFRVAKDQAFLLIFCHPSRWSTLVSMAEAVGWRTFKAPIVWVKNRASVLGDMWPRRGYETIMLASKGLKPLRDPAAIDIIEVDVVYRPVHRAEKPVELGHILAKWFMRFGEVVLDPFCGTGNLLIGPLREGCRVIGVEKDEKWIELAKERLSCAMSEDTDTQSQAE